MTYLDGHKETEPWILREGKAQVNYSNGDCFVGHFNSQREKHGVGEYTWVHEDDTSTHFSGRYVNGERSGYGVCKYATGDIYEGFWDHNQRQGQGTLRFTNGDVFSGEWSNDKRNGHGAYVFASSQLVGNWVDNECVRGKWIRSDLSSYNGQFEDGKPIGSGIFCHSNKQCQEGKYVKTESKEEDDALTAEFTTEFIGGQVSYSRDGPEKLLTSQVAKNPLKDFILTRKRVSREPPIEVVVEQEEEEEAVKGELGEIKAIFNGIIEGSDGDQDGKLDIDEWLDAVNNSPLLTEALPALSDRMMHQFFNLADADHDSKISLSEFESYFYIVRLFLICDTDHTGKVRHQELREGLMKHPEQFPKGFAEGNSRVAVSAYLSTGDDDGDRLLSLPEFAQMMIFLQQAPQMDDQSITE